MGHLRNLPKHKNPSFLSQVGSKIMSAAELAGAAKGLFDIGRGIYTGIRTVAPLVAQGVRTIGPMVASAALL
jgi:hypothetical protein